MGRGVQGKRPGGGAKVPNATSFKPGQSGNPKGRPKGSKNFENRLTNEERQALAKATGGLTPLELFVSICRDETVSIMSRLDAAKAAAPYVHKRMPIQIEGGDPNKPINLMDVTALKNLSTAEIAALVALLQKAGANIKTD